MIKFAGLIFLFLHRKLVGTCKNYCATCLENMKSHMWECIREEHYLQTLIIRHQTLHIMSDLTRIFNIFSWKIIEKKSLITNHQRSSLLVYHSKM